MTRILDAAKAMATLHGRILCDIADAAMGIATDPLCPATRVDEVSAGNVDVACEK